MNEQGPLPPFADLTLGINASLTFQEGLQRPFQTIQPLSEFALRSRFSRSRINLQFLSVNLQ